MTVHPMVIPPLPPPSSLLSFHQVPLTNFWYPFILLGGEGYYESKLFCTKTKHMTWQGYNCRSLSVKIAALGSRWKRSLLLSGNYQSLSYSLPFINLFSHRQLTGFRTSKARQLSETYLRALIFFCVSGHVSHLLLWFLYRDMMRKMVKQMRPGSKWIELYSYLIRLLSQADLRA